MTKFYNYINEAALENLDLSRFKEECYPALQDIKQNRYRFLYSGRQSSDPITRREVRKNRRPMDTPYEIHNLLDEEFKNKFGVKARSQSMFANPVSDLVSFYGKPFFLFPVGKKYMYLWSDHISDLFSYLDDKIKLKYDLSPNTSMRVISKLIEDEGSFCIDMSQPLNDRLPINPNSKISNSDMKEVTKEEHMDTLGKIAENTVQLYKKSKTIKPFAKVAPVEVMVVADYVWLISKNLVSDPEMKNWMEENI